MAALLALGAVTACTVAHGHAGRRAERNAWTIPGVLRMAGRQEPENLNPLLGTQTIDIDLSMFWAGYLFDWSDRNTLVPELAQRVPTLENGDIAKDGLAITYHLRRGVRWQDGAPFDAADVIYTWRQMLNPRNLVVSRGGYDLVSRIDELDRYTVTVHLQAQVPAVCEHVLHDGEPLELHSAQTSACALSGYQPRRLQHATDRNRTLSHRQL